MHVKGQSLSKEMHMSQDSLYQEAPFRAVHTKKERLSFPIERVIVINAINMSKNDDIQGPLSVA